MTSLPDSRTAAQLLRSVIDEGVDPFQERKRFVAFLEDLSWDPRYAAAPFKPHHKKALCVALDYPPFSTLWDDYRKGRPVKRNLDGLAAWLSRGYGYASDLCAWTEAVWSHFFECAVAKRSRGNTRGGAGRTAAAAPVGSARKLPAMGPRTRAALAVFMLSAAGIYILATHRSAVEPDAASSGTSKDTFSDCALCPTMVVVPAGTVALGSRPETEPERKDNEHYIPSTAVTKPFALSKHEVTVGNWKACVASGGCRNRTPPNIDWNDERKPVTNVSWDDAASYCQWLKRETGQNYRLPSELEWEYAARARHSDSRFSWGNALIPDRANCSDCFKMKTYTGRPYDVGSFRPNDFELYDMEGNVWEWTADCYVDNLIHGAARTCDARVIRGGSYGNPASAMRLARRVRIPPANDKNRSQYNEYYASYIGFRVARDL